MFRHWPGKIFALDKTRELTFHKFHKLYNHFPDIILTIYMRSEKISVLRSISLWIVLDLFYDASFEWTSTRPTVAFHSLFGDQLSTWLFTRASCKSRAQLLPKLKLKSAVPKMLCANWQPSWATMTMFEKVCSILRSAVKTELKTAVLSNVLNADLLQRRNCSPGHSNLQRVLKLCNGADVLSMRMCYILY